MKTSRIFIDDVFFQLETSPSGIARLWKEAVSSPYLMHRLAEQGLSLTILSRSGIDISEGQFETIRFPTFDYGFPALDTLVLDDFCLNEGVDLFVSTYYTFPTVAPTWTWCYDLIPEVKAGPYLDQEIGWQHRSLSLYNCENFVSISKSTNKDLFRHYPHSSSKRNEAVAYPWVSQSMMQAISQNPRNKSGGPRKEKPYILLVGSRHQLDGYKNGIKVFDAANHGAFPDVDIVCVGGEILTEEESSAGSNFGVEVKRIVANDLELINLYSGALALMVLSTYEGFGIPVIEALACGIPVVSLANSSLTEAGGTASTYLPDDSPSSIRAAIKFVQEKHNRVRIREIGPVHAASFAMEASIDSLVDSLLIALQQPNDYALSSRSRWWREQMTMLSQIEI